MSALIPFSADVLFAMPGWRPAELWSHVHLSDARQAVLQQKHRHDAERIAVVPAAKLGRCAVDRFDHFEELHALLAPPMMTSSTAVAVPDGPPSTSKREDARSPMAPPREGTVAGCGDTTQSDDDSTSSDEEAESAILPTLAMTVEVTGRAVAARRDGWFGNAAAAGAPTRELLLNITVERPANTRAAAGPSGSASVDAPPPTWKIVTQRSWPQLLALVDHVRDCEPGLWLPPFPRDLDSSVQRRDAAVDPGWLASQVLAAVRANPTTLGRIPLVLSFLFDSEEAFDLTAGWTRAWDASVARERAALIAAASPAATTGLSAWISSWTGASAAPQLAPSAVAQAAIAAKNAPITDDWLEAVKRRALGYAERSKRYVAAAAAARSLDACVTQELAAVEGVADVLRSTAGLVGGPKAANLHTVLGVDDPDSPEVGPSAAVLRAASKDGAAGALECLLDQWAGLNSVCASLVAHCAASATEAQESHDFCQGNLDRAIAFQEEWHRTVECEKRGQQRTAMDLAAARRCLTHEVLLLRSSIDSNTEKGLRSAREHTRTNLFAATVMAASLGKTLYEPARPEQLRRYLATLSAPFPTWDHGSGPTRATVAPSLIDDGRGTDLDVDWE